MRYINRHYLSIYYQSPVCRWHSLKHSGRLSLLFASPWLPSKLQSITADWPVPNYTARLQRQLWLITLPTVITW